MDKGQKEFLEKHIHDNGCIEYGRFEQVLKGMEPPLQEKVAASVRPETDVVYSSTHNIQMKELNMSEETKIIIEKLARKK